MNEHIIRTAMTEEANQLAPEPVNLWPRVAARLKRRERTQAVRRFAVRAVIVSLAVFVVSLGVSPQLRAAVVGAVLQMVGAIARPGQPTLFSPNPPFVVKQPEYLPESFVKTWEVYYSGDPTLPMMRVQARTMTLDWQPSEAVAQRVRERETGSEARLIFTYEARDGQYVLLFERAAKRGEALPPGEPRTVASQAASLQRGDQKFTLAWIVEGTWIELESTLAEAETLKIAEGLKTSQTLTSPPPSEIAENLSNLPFCDPRDDPPDRYILGKVKGQQHKGDVIIELHDRPKFPESVAFGSDVPDLLDEVLKPALATLQDFAIPTQRLPYRSISSFGHSELECLVPNPDVQGYFVIEVWERQVNIGYGGAALEMRARAIKELEEEIQNRQSP